VKKRKMKRILCVFFRDQGQMKFYEKGKQKSV